MYGDGNLLNWSVLGDKVQGASHISKNKPCQDAYQITIGNDFIVASVADGHGSDACPYSDEGSQLAVDVANYYFSEILNSLRLNQAYLFMQKNLDTKIPRDLEMNWKEKLKETHQRHNREFPSDEEIFKLYGTTLLSLVVTKYFFFSAQIGDGDILSVYPSGETMWFIDPDKQLGSETFSLSSKDSWKHIKAKLSPVVDSSGIPHLFILSTDGYSNSFVSDDAFLKIGFDYLELLKLQGRDFIQENLQEWLTSASGAGSGDDIALALVFNDAIVGTKKGQRHPLPGDKQQGEED